MEVATIKITMSADNWAVCPKCGGGSNEAAKNARRVANESYGKVPSERWLELEGEAKILEESNEEPSCKLREDYEIGIFQGQFEVSYKGQCENCGFEFRHSFKKKV